MGQFDPMFDPDFDPLAELMRMQLQVTNLENTLEQLIQATNTNHHTIQGILKTQQNLAEAHRELVNYVTTTRKTDQS